MLDALRRGVELDPQEPIALARRVRSLALGLDAAELRELVAVIGELERELEQQRDELQQTLRKTSSSRRALRGYGHLSAHMSAQRVTRRV